LYTRGDYPADNDSVTVSDNGVKSVFSTKAKGKFWDEDRPIGIFCYRRIYSHHTHSKLFMDSNLNFDIFGRYLNVNFNLCPLFTQYID